MFPALHASTIDKANAGIESNSCNTSDALVQEAKQRQNHRFLMKELLHVHGSKSDVGKQTIITYKTTLWSQKAKAFFSTSILP